MIWIGLDAIECSELDSGSSDFRGQFELVRSISEEFGEVGFASEDHDPFGMFGIGCSVEGEAKRG